MFVVKGRWWYVCLLIRLLIKRVLILVLYIYLLGCMSWVIAFWFISCSAEIWYLSRMSLGCIRVVWLLYVGGVAGAGVLGILALELIEAQFAESVSPDGSDRLSRL